MLLDVGLISLSGHNLPLSPISIGSDTENGAADRSEHEDQRDAPGDLSCGLIKRLGQVRDGQGHGEEVEGIPGPREEGDQKEQPLLCVEQREQLEGVRDLGHGRLQCRHASPCIFCGGHVLLCGVDGLQRGRIADVLVIGSHDERLAGWLAERWVMEEQRRGGSKAPLIAGAAKYQAGIVGVLVYPHGNLPPACVEGRRSVGVQALECDVERLTIGVKSHTS
jgi:hypothetical protein